jgi:hypothetical protein
VCRHFGFQNQGRALPSAGNRPEPCRPHAIRSRGADSSGSGLRTLPLDSDARAFHGSPLICLCLLTNELLSNNSGGRRL